MAAKSPQPKFEEAVEELEQIIEKIEAGAIGLEDCLAAYERGMKLIGQCRTVLTTVEQRIAELSVDAAGKLRIQEGASAGSEGAAPGAAGPDDGDLLPDMTNDEDVGP